jgi:deoxyribonuclease V
LFSKRNVFDVPDLPRELMALVARVPPGKVTTPLWLATALGTAKAAVWVAAYTLDHVHDSQCPCHRVVRAGGLLGGHVTGFVEEKRRRLAAEGVAVADGRVDLAAHGYRPQLDRPPLAPLVRRQAELAAELRDDGGPLAVSTVAAVDASYDRGLAIAAFVLCAWPSGNLLWSTTASMPIRFPYISSLLAFRELPVMLAAVERAQAAGKLGDLLLVDGAGRLHPRAAGIAAHLGLAAEQPTIGVTKRLLYGACAAAPELPGRPALVYADGAVAGFAILPRARTRRPLYVSPGHRSSVELCLRIVPPLLLGHRLPEPLYWADRLSRAEARSARSGLPPAVAAARRAR